MEHPDVDRAAVIGRPGHDGRCQLIAFYQSSRLIDPAEWQARLRDRLPAYMVPFTLCPIDALPLTAQGKIDRRRLADLEVGDAARPVHAPAVTPTEKLVVATFERRMGIARIGLRDNFFDLGGHSLMAIQITAELSQALGKEVALRDIFSAPDVGALALKLDDRLEDGSATGLALFREDSYEVVL